MKTKKEIEKQIEALKTVRPKIVPKSTFGEDNLERLDAQVAVLEKLMDDEDIWDRWDDEDIISHALDARRWLEGYGDIEDLAEDWPLK